MLALVEMPLTLALSWEGRGDDGVACGARFERFGVARGL